MAEPILMIDTPPKEPRYATADVFATANRRCKVALTVDKATVTKLILVVNTNVTKLFVCNLHF